MGATAEKPDVLRSLAAMAALAGLYYAAARFGLSWAVLQENVTAIWPPSGLAIAVLARFGFRLWPGIFLGSVAANLSTSAGLQTSVAIGAGDTLEAVLAVVLLASAGFDQRLGRLSDVFRLIVFGGAVAPLVAAVNGAAQICLAGLAPWSQYTKLALAWWFGDGLSIIVVTPFLLAWLIRPGL
jgi:integral membrane sensor domain MASE1